MMKRTPETKRQHNEKIGRRAETIAALYYRLCGYKILAMRYRAPGGEIDLVAKRGRLIAFVEVKSRASLDAAIEAVTPQTSRRIASAADMFIAHSPHFAEFDMRYDIFALAGWRFRCITDAWREGE